MRISFTLLFILLNACASSQIKRSYNWVTGYSGNKVNFGSGITTSQGLSPFKYFTSGNSCISDTNGNLIISSNGYDVFNSTGNFMDNGDTLIPKDYYIAHNGSSFNSQTSIILPMDSNKYYFITPAFSDIQYYDCQQNNNCYFDLLLYNVIDMNANAGAGKVTQRMVPILQNARLRKTQMMACRHSNGNDWWLLKQEGDSANVHTFLFTQDSVYDKGVQIFNEPVWGGWDIRGQSTFNSDGTQYATTSHGGSTGLIMIANFDRCYGLLSNSYVIQMPLGSQHNPNDTTMLDRESVGLAFSPSNKFLYVISYTNVYQYDLQDSTWFYVAGLDTTYNVAQGYETAYVSPDNKIYIGNFGGTSKQMSRIDNPNVKGAGCNFCPRCLRLDSLGTNAYVGTPPCMPNYALGVQECWPLSAHDIKDKSTELTIYPNPANSILRIQTTLKAKRELYNSIGQLIILTDQNEINMSQLNSGIYYLKVGSVIKKVVVE